MIKKIIVLLAFVTTGMVSGQRTTLSPYSFFGVGSFRDVATVENKSMGELQMHSDSIHLNLRNPAAMSKLRMTTYGGSIAYNSISLSEPGFEDAGNVVNLEYLALGFPIANNWGAVLGLMPYSSVGFNLSENALDNLVTM